jgi:TatD DNase family protein
MNLLVDSHCHLDFPEFADDLAGVMARAGAAGVGMCVTICTRLSKFDQVLAVAERFDNVYCSVGVHPHEAENEGQRTAGRLIELAAHPKVVGIGETGLDFYYDRSPRDLQAASFRAHIAAARETGLPLIVHSRDADAETADILADEMGKGAYPGLMHCFSSGAELAEKAVELGLYISLSGIATFRTAEALREIARAVPRDRLLVETDAPFLAPVPHRGKRNEPAFVADTAAVVAGLHGLTTDALAALTTDNFFRLFTRADRARLRAA